MIVNAQQEQVPLYATTIPNSKPGPNEEKAEITPIDRALTIPPWVIERLTPLRRRIKQQQCCDRNSNQCERRTCEHWH